MKTVLVALVAYLACFGSAKELIADAVKACNTELDIPDDADYLVKFAKGNIEENEKIQCFIKCVMVRLGAMKDGTIVAEKVIEFRKEWLEGMKNKGVVVDVEKLKTDIEACRSAGGGEAKCEKEYLQGKCATALFREIEKAHNIVWELLESQDPKK